MSKENLSLENLWTFLQNYPGCLFLKDEQGRYLYASDLCDNLEQWPTGGIVGKNELQAQADHDLGREYYRQDMQLLRQGGTLKCYSEVKHPEGSTFYEINKSAVQDNQGNRIGIIGTVVDVTREYQLQEHIQRELITDPITGLYNNTFLEHWKEEERTVLPLSVIAADCNFLKHINDTFGHEKGDELLKAAAKLFTDLLPDHCYPIRTGGDEFVILCNHTTWQNAQEYITLLQQKSGNISICGIPLSIAMGSCTMDAPSRTLDECIQLADARMYENKRTMKQRYLEEEGKSNPIYNESLMRRILDQMPVVLFFKDTQCRYQYINVFDARNLRNEKEAGLGIGCTDLEIQKDPALAREYYEDDLRILQTGKGSVLMNAISGEDGIRHYQITKSALRDEKNNIIGIVGSVMDITAAKLDFQENS